MKRLALLSALVFIPALPAAAAVAHQTVVHVANGDCAGLEQALNVGAQSAAGVETGPTGELIVLAKNGSYPNCFISATTPTITGSITIDGNGSTITLNQQFDSQGNRTKSGGIEFSGSPITVRNVNFDLFKGATLGNRFVHNDGPAFVNNGDLILESSSILLEGLAGIGNGGHLVLKNVTVTDTPAAYGPAVISTGYIQTGVVAGVTTYIPATVDIEQSTISVHNFSSIFYFGNITVSNSILMTGSPGGCFSVQPMPPSPYNQYAPITGPTSLGGNIVGDNSCGYNAPTDHIVTDASLADFGNHGGVVGTLALNFNSPARGAGLAANCAAADARGVARGSAHCDAGAYEFGGGYGQLAASGISGTYYDAAHDGHYVTVQNLDNGNVLVIWNTFNEQGHPAWVYGVGTVSGRTIHVANVSQNLGGVLQPGGTVTGSKETDWGSFDFTTNDCLSATLAYQSNNPIFGSGSVNLTRIAFINGLDCSN